jgi:hypothetical protein
MCNDPRWTPRVDQSRAVDVLQNALSSLIDSIEVHVSTGPDSELSRDLDAARDALRKAGAA